MVFQRVCVVVPVIPMSVEVRLSICFVCVLYVGSYLLI